MQRTVCIRPTLYMHGARTLHVVGMAIIGAFELPSHLRRRPESS